MKRISKILIANRGEIAVRVIRTAHDLGIKTVAVYSDADAHAPHVTFADEAVCIGAAPVGESYLVAENIIKAAQDTNADAIHPGYGFLSENADFANAVEAAGFIFIGPTADAINLMGNKAEAKRRMIEAGVPCVPGYEGEDQSDKVLLAKSKDIGFPLMVKAVAGGGGRGMRLVHDKKDLPNAIETARSEAENAFGSGELILEKAIIEPRHVEFQVFADTHGTAVHLGERDCSVQRRHQKVIEEAPCPVMTEDLRAKMGAAAVEAAQAIHYRGAGTVEFLLDQDGGFYFLEMNTRLQVEHPVTEEITGLDLVALQIKVAQGEALGLSQDDINLTGHAIEIRLYAEDPENEFLPATGKIALWQPAMMEGVRYDAGIETGQEVSPFYDPMLAKIIAYGENRDIARTRLIAGLENTALFGVRNNRDFLIDCLRRARFIEGEATTAFIAEEFGESGIIAAIPQTEDAAAMAVLHFLSDRTAMQKKTIHNASALLNFTTQINHQKPYKLIIGDAEFSLTVNYKDTEQYHIICGEDEVRVEVLTQQDNQATLAVNGRKMVAIYKMQEGQLFISLAGKNWQSRNLLNVLGDGEEVGSGGRVLAPLHGRVIDVFVKDGDKVEQGARLAIIEAMKMQHEILAAADGTVKHVFITADQQVSADDLIIEIEAHDKETE